MRPWLVLGMLGGTACEGVSEASDRAVCDGRLQPSESFVDSPWDRDGDGYFDFTDLFCSETYGLSRFDCDDNNPEVHVDAVEVACNGIDDDCNFRTRDGEDVDGDGVTDCFDCDDNDPSRSPEFAELCWDDIDNDCDGEVDPDCGPNYNGVYDLAVPIQYSCAQGLVDLDITQVEAIWAPPLLTIVPLTTYPDISMTGTVDEGGNFRVSVQLQTDCNQRYGMEGLFTSEDTILADFRATWGRQTCLGCVSPFASYLSAEKQQDGKKTTPN